MDETHAAILCTQHTTARDPISGIGASDPSLGGDNGSILTGPDASGLYVLFVLHLAMRVLEFRPTKPPSAQRRLASSRRLDVLCCAVLYCIMVGAREGVAERCCRVGMEAQHLRDTP